MDTRVSHRIIGLSTVTDLKESLLPSSFRGIELFLLQISSVIDTMC